MGLLTQSNIVPLGRLKASGTALPSIPGAQWQSVATQAIVANQVRYQGFIVDTPITVDQLITEITATGTATLLRMGIYAADTDWQPVGAPIVDGGTVSAASATTLTISVNVTLQPGRYLTALNADGSATLRCYRGDGTRGAWGASAALGAASINAVVTATQSFGAFPTPGTAFVSGGISPAAAAPFHVMLIRISAP